MPRTTLRLAAAALIGIAMALSRIAHAQQQVPLQIGARVRVVADTFGSRAETGIWQGINGNTLQLDRGSQRYALPLGSVTRLEQSQGNKPNVPAGILGLILGAGIGGTLGCLANSDDYGVFCGGQDDTKVIVGATLGGVAGALVGGLVFRKEKWSPVSLPGLRSTGTFSRSPNLPDLASRPAAQVASWFRE